MGPELEAWYYAGENTVYNSPMPTPVTITGPAQGEQLLAVLASSISSWPKFPGNNPPQTPLPCLIPGSVPVFPQLKGMCGMGQNLSPSSPSCRHAMHSRHGDKQGCLLPLLMKLVLNNHILNSWVWPQLNCFFPLFHPLCLPSAPVSQSTAEIHTGQC